MSDPRTMDCEVWAKQKAKTLLDKAKVELLDIRPGFKQVISGIKIPPNDEMIWPFPAWHYHVAVLSQGLVYDELRPLGLPLEQYKQLFQYSYALTFTVKPFP